MVTEGAGPQKCLGLMGGNSGQARSYLSFLLSPSDTSSSSGIVAPALENFLARWYSSFKLNSRITFSCANKQKNMHTHQGSEGKAQSLPGKYLETRMGRKRQEISHSPLPLGGGEG